MPFSLRILCWNINEGAGGLDKIAEQIRKKSPDIVLLNEIREKRMPWDVDQTSYLSQKTGLKYYKFGETVMTGITGWKGVSILSRYPLGVTTMHPVMRGSQPTTFGTLEATIRINSVDHRVFSTRFAPLHKPGSPAYDPNAANDNVAGHQQAINLVRRIPPRVPVIFGGDFNANQSSEQMRQFAASSGLTDVFSERPDPEVNNPDERIDCIFYRGSYKVNQMEQRAPWTDGVSDHAWVFAELLSTETSECVQIRSQIAKYREEIRLLQESKNSLNPRDRIDRQEILQINKDIASLGTKIRGLEERAASLGCG